MIVASVGPPLHPLFVHVPIVLVPVSTLGVLALIVRPAWLRTYGWLVAAASAIGTAGAAVAAQTGEALEEQRRTAGQPFSAELQRHVDAGATARRVVVLGFVITIVWLYLARRNAGSVDGLSSRRRAWWMHGLAALSLLTGIAATVFVVVAGHSGAVSVWVGR